MDNKILSFLASFFFSTRLMAFLFLFFAAAMGAGTFIESYYNTETARIWIYNTTWFEFIMFFFMINFFGNIKRYQLHKREKWATLLLHLSFIFIIAGAGITRYISYEGVMPIREGESSNQIFSEKTFLTVNVDGNYNGNVMRKVKEKALLLSPAVCWPFATNDFTISDNFSKIPFKIEYVDFIMNAKEQIKEDKNGIVYLKMVESGGGQRHEHFLKSGEVVNIHNVLFALNKFTPGAININTTSESYSIQTPFEGNFMRMADKMQGKVVKDSAQPLMMRSLYNVGGAQFVFPEPAMKGSVGYVSNNDYKDKTTDDALVVKVSNEGQEKIVTLLGAKGKVGEPVAFKLDNLEYTLTFGSKVYTTPFYVKLNDFIAEKYPGTTNSYSSYESKVRVLDGKSSFDQRIYMNHVLDYKGFRLFQASYDKDEKGTILSVNHDFYGTWTTYIGYFLLFFALMAILFDKNTRFGDLKRKLEKVKDKKAQLLTIFLLFIGIAGSAQSHDHEKRITRAQVDSIIKKYTIKEEHAAQFGRIVIQDDGGRMKPINTFSSELLRKVSKKDTYNDMNSDQVFLSMSQYPRLWFEVPLIYLKAGNDSLRGIIGVPKDAKYAALVNFFDDKGNYKLSKYLDAAYKTAEPNQFEKDFKDVDQKVNFLGSALSGSILKIFPVPNDPNNKWVSYLEISHPTGTALDTVKNILPAYFNSLVEASESKSYTMANTWVTGVENYQKKYGSKVRPSDDKISSEILYNKYDVFRNLYLLYMTFGTFMLLFVIANILMNKKFMRYIISFMSIIIKLLFFTHTLGLIARWYISGHAPWSNAYESMIYVAWATMLFTLLFSSKLAHVIKYANPTVWLLTLFRTEANKKSPLVVAAGTFVASMILMVAHWNWLDPEIANLQPVLNSYWLMIHVAVIVASYGPFTLAMVLGLVSMLLMLCTTEKNKIIMKLHIQEITYINEMALTIGLVMLTIGNFLGGQWANESWGRYWGWDPKETWALISIMIYAFVIHARFVPFFRGLYTYNFMSVLAFATILMTYFGVNFHLTGLHSYASGERQNVIIYLYVFVGYIIFSALVYWRYKQFYKKEK
ncbi:MAG: cytochrome c biogenesis protein CcsA [Flavobacterium sp.]|nr:cytochrome c biogenesis protein CcsA [Flavobacterium sp.]